MDINIILLLATLFTATHQNPPDFSRGMRQAFCKSHPHDLRFDWQHYSVYTDDCPVTQELWNPFSGTPQPSDEEICLCEGTYKMWPLTQHNRGKNHICSKISTHTHPQNFLVCWTNKGQKNSKSRYTLAFPGTYSIGGSCSNEIFIPLVLEKYYKDDNLLQTKLKTDPRCNPTLGEIARAQKLELKGHCKQRDCKPKNIHTHFFKQRHKKGLR